MGNELIAEEIASKMNHKKRVSFKRFISSKIAKKKNSERDSMKTKCDSFFLSYLENNKRGTSEIMDDIKSFDQRRQVFVSLIGLFRSWTKMPSHVLYSAIFILPLKRKWIYDIIKYRNEYMAHDIIKFTQFQQNTEETKQFIEMLKWKDSQGLIFWMMDDYRSDNVQDDEMADNNNDIAPFWKHVSTQLTQLYDPVSRQNYNPIPLDVAFWEKQRFKPKYQQNVSSIIPELQYLSNMRYVAIQEIIFQSNPSSLNPIISYGESYGDKQSEKICSKLPEENEGDAQTKPLDIDLGEGWWISDDYDPYDVEDQEMCKC